jgi:hypothetical protein
VHKTNKLVPPSLCRLELTPLKMHNRPENELNSSEAGVLPRKSFIVRDRARHDNQSDFLAFRCRFSNLNFKTHLNGGEVGKS